ncbi:MAG: glyoxalase, partial [Deinococcota bacterium]
RSRGGGWFVLPDRQQLHLSVTPNFVPREKGHPALRCPDLTAFRTRCDAYGVPDRPDAEANVPRVFLRDPFGNRLEVVEGKHESVPADGTS